VPGLFLIAPAASYTALGVAMIPLAVGSGVSQPCLNALLSRLSREDEQGGILGLNQSLGSLARVVGPAVGTAAFARLGIGSPYLLGGSLMAVATVLAAAAVWPLLRAAGGASPLGAPGSAASRGASKNPPPGNGRRE
jgi:predicted MFS family arabinose efflux permease